MLLSTNTGSFTKRFTVEEAVSMIADAGFDAIDISFFNNDTFYKVDPDTPSVAARLKNLRALAESKGVVFNQAHGPNPSSVADEAKNPLIFENIVRCMKSAAMLGAPHIVIHPMQHLTYSEDGVPEKLFEINMDFYGRLLPYCKAFGIKVALENMWQMPRGKKIDHSTCSRPAEFIRYLDALDKEWFIGCLDIGHAFLVSEDPADFIRALGKDRLKALHVHDVDGFDDLHTLPYLGSINWAKTTKALGEIGYTGDFTYEAGKFLSAFPNENFPAALSFMESVGRGLMRKTGL